MTPHGSPDRQEREPVRKEDQSVVIQKLLDDLPPDVRRKILNGEEASAEESAVDRVFTRWEREDRRKRFAYTRQEVADMNPVAREGLTQLVILVYLDELKEFRARENPALPPDDLENHTTELMDAFWKNRGKNREDMEFYQAEQMEELRGRLAEYERQKQALVETIQRLRGKTRLTKPAQKILKEAERELRENFSLRVEDGWTRPSDFGYEKREMTEDKRKMRMLSHLAELQETLAYLLAYLEPLDFSVYFAEVMDYEMNRDRGFQVRRAYTDKQRADLGKAIQASKDRIGGAAQKWYDQHENERALMTPKKISSGERLERLIAHARNLLLSRKMLSEEGRGGEKSALENTERELEVALRLLKSRH